MFYHPASQNLLAEDKVNQRICASTGGELLQLTQSKRTSSIMFRRK